MRVPPPMGLTSTAVFEEERDGEVGVLAVVDGPDKGTERTFTPRTVTVGSGPNADLQLNDPTVSRLHCEVTFDVRGARLRDLGSKNGTWIGKCRVHEVTLGAGAWVRLGMTTLEARTSIARTRQIAWRGGDQLGPMLGASAAMHTLFATVARLGETDARVLIRGESGTGKELVARTLHDLGPRRHGPFVVVDGAALPRTLADVELFGHAQGAFTGADQERVGAFERAHGGTLFLDEVGEVPLDVQPKLLRVLQEGTVQRIGEGTRRATDVRVIAATHRPLARMVNEGTFREDLLYRLAVVEVDVPPLRDRTSDVPLLADAVVREVVGDDADRIDEVRRALATRAGYPWPGNVRELRSFVRRVLLLGDTGAQGPSAITAPTGVRVDLGYHEAKRLWVERFEREYIPRLLDEAGGNVSEAARRSGINRPHLSDMLQKLGLRGKK